MALAGHMAKISRTEAYKLEGLNDATANKLMGPNC